MNGRGAFVDSAVNAAIIKIMKVIAGKEDISECPTAISQLSSTKYLQSF